MNTHRLFTSVILSLLVGMMGNLLWGGTLALAAPSLIVPIEGTVHVTGPTADNVPLSGQARLTTTLVTDTTFNSAPGVILTIDILNAHGKGLSTNQQYISSGTDQVYRTRLLATSDVIEITFPFFPAGPRKKEAALWALASFKLTYNTSTGEIIGASGTIDTP